MQPTSRYALSGILGRSRGPLLVGMFLAYGLAPAMNALAAEPSRPNVLFIISDDMNNSAGCYDHPFVKTPNIDKLAQQGVRFDRAYCQFPLCGPSRNSMLTGLYPNSTGILGNAQIFRQTIPSHISLPQAFRRDGYFVARIGKLYHYNVPKSIGTDGHDDPGSWEMELNPAGCDRLIEEPDIFTLKPMQFGGVLSWYASPRGDLEHTDGMIASDAEWVLERCAKQKDRPFFLAVGFFRPHTPYVAPESYFENYPKEKMPLVKGLAEDLLDIPAMALQSHRKEHADMTDDLRRQAKQAYFSSITFMDAQVGRVLAKLEALGLAENTIVVFTSDHGYHLGEHTLWQKQSLFEESARVPFIIAAPGAGAKGKAAAAPVGLIDLYPTLTELCGVEAPDNLQGQSLVPMLKDASVEGRGWTLTQVTRRGKGGRVHGYSIRTPRWRFTEWDEGRGEYELYDHDRDPGERANLFMIEEHAGTMKELKEKLRSAVAATFPPSGETPPLRPGLWRPNLTHP